MTETYVAALGLWCRDQRGGLVNDLVSIGMKNAPGRVLRGAFFLVAGVGFEPSTSGL